MKILEAWFKKAVAELQVGEELRFEVESKLEAQSKKKALIKFKREYEELDPIGASLIDIKTDRSLEKFWVLIIKRATSPLMGFKKCADGTTERIILDNDLNRERRLKLMINDGLTLEEVEEIEGSLTPDERKLFKETSKIDVHTE
jgi:hypothetical protein